MLWSELTKSEWCKWEENWGNLLWISRYQIGTEEVRDFLSSLQFLMGKCLQRSILSCLSHIIIPTNMGTFNCILSQSEITPVVCTCSQIHIWKHKIEFRLKCFSFQHSVLPSDKEKNIYYSLSSSSKGNNTKGLRTRIGFLPDSI